MSLDFKDVWAKAVLSVQEKNNLKDPNFILGPNSKEALDALSHILDNGLLDTHTNGKSGAFLPTELEIEQLSAVFLYADATGVSTVSVVDNPEVLEELIIALREALNDRVLEYQETLDKRPPQGLFWN